MIKEIIIFYDDRSANRHKAFLLESTDPQLKKFYDEQKRDIDQLLNGFIQTLINEFGETSIKATSPKREKLALLKKLVTELDSHYSD